MTISQIKKPEVYQQNHITKVTRSDFRGDIRHSDYQVMHMTSGEFDGEIKEKRQDLINKYIGDVLKDKKLRLLKGRASDRSFVVRPETPTPQPIINMRASENKGLSTEPFLNMLQLPRNKRPSTLQECINFFYPTSSVFSKSGEYAPFTSTSLTAYSFGKNDAGNIPLFLGDVSMMYGWFLIYRRILCPTQFPSNKPTQFLNCTEDFFVDPDGVRDAKETFGASSKKLGLISTGFDLLRGAVELVNSSDFNYENLLDDFNNLSLTDILEQGLSAVSDIIVGEMLADPEFSNDIASFIVNGLYDSKAYESITKLPSSNKTKLALGELALDKLNTFGIRGPDLAKLQDFVFTADIDEIPGGYSNLSVAGKRFVEDRVQDLEERYLSDFTSFSGKTIPPPHSPFHIGFAGLATAALITTIQGGLDYATKAQKHNFEGYIGYLTTHLKCLTEDYQDPNIQFAFMTHIRSGKWEHPNLPIFDGDWEAPPDCELQQGGQIFRYWEYVFDNFITYIRQTKLRYSEYEEFPDFYLNNNGFLEATLRQYDIEDLSPITETESNTDRHWTTCSGTELLANTSFTSTLKVIEKLRDFSPFTHAYGFAPIINFNATNTQGQRYIYLNGKAQRSYLGKDSNPPSRVNINRTDGGQGHQLASIAPNRTYPYSWPAPSSDFTLTDVEKFLRKKPLGSRRQLNGRWGGRTSVSFDVGLGDDTPVMDAQFCAFISVLFCYREAVETFKGQGPQWAKHLRTYKPKINVNADLLRYMRGREFSLTGEHFKVHSLRGRLEKIRVKFKALSKQLDDITATEQDVGIHKPSPPPKVNQTVAYASIIATLGGAGLLINKLRKFNP